MMFDCFFIMIYNLILILEYFFEICNGCFINSISCSSGFLSLMFGEVISFDPAWVWFCKIITEGESEVGYKVPDRINKRAPVALRKFRIEKLL